VGSSGQPGEERLGFTVNSVSGNVNVLHAVRA
jgi:hypothetical protein